MLYRPVGVSSLDLSAVQKWLNGRILSYSQVVDTGLDETSCFFADDDGLEVEHGYLVGHNSTNFEFTYDLSRRKVM